MTLPYKRIPSTRIVVQMILFVIVSCTKPDVKPDLNNKLIYSNGESVEKTNSPLEKRVFSVQALKRQKVHHFTKQSKNYHFKSAPENKSGFSNERLSPQGLSYSRKLSEFCDSQKKNSKKTIGPHTDALQSPRNENLVDSPYNTIKDNVDDSPGRGHGDLFSCPPCNCSYTHKRFIKADCTYRNLTKLPQTLPIDVWVIDMSHNKLQAFDTSSVLKYPKLTSLDLNTNFLHSVNGQMKGNAISNIRELILNDNYINEIENGCLCLMKKLVTLQISHNKLTKINNSFFRCLKNLKQLDLSVNNITSIDDAAFDSLGMLSDLFLQSNKRLSYDREHFPPRIVRHLQRLRTLWIQGNSFGSQHYPDVLLGNLRNLQNLSIDGLTGNVEFGPELKKLRYFRILSFGPNAICKLKNISSTFFQHTVHLESLTFIRCRLLHIDPKAFKALPKLTDYTLKYIHSNHYNLDRAFQDLEFLNTQNSSLRSLTFDYVHHSSTPCVVLSSKQGEHIKNMRLTSLNLDKNLIALIRDDFLWNIPKTLQCLSLRQNKITIDDNLIGRMSMLNNLHELDLSDQNINTQYHPSKVEYYKPVFIKQQCMKEDYDHEGEKVKLFGDAFESLHHLLLPPSAIPAVPQDRNGLSFSNYKKTCSRSRQCAKFLKAKEKIPPNLLTLQATRFMYFASLVLFKSLSRNNLKILNCSFNFQSNWGKGHLPQNIVTADFSHNQCSYLSKSFFPPNNSLVALYVKGNLLGNVFSCDSTGSLMSHLDKLNFLDISANLIFSLPPHFFKGLKNLKTLKMKDNKLRRLGIRLSHLKLLNYIDASDNSISWISQQTRNDLDFLANITKEHVIVDLTNNPLPCTCDGLEILHWMATSKVYFTNEYFLWCAYSNGSRGSLSDIKSVIRTLHSVCTPESTYKYLIIGLASGFSGLTLALLFCAFIYRQRWRILYSINNGFLVKIFGFRPRGNYDGLDFKFDAYVVYAEEDRKFVLDDLLEEMEEKRGHKVCVDDRDFLPGTYKFNNINSAVKNSTVTLLFVSENFIRENDFGYAVQMALLEEYMSQNKREVCYLVLYGQFPTSQLPKDLQMLMMKNRFIEFPTGVENETNADDCRKFWDRLSLVIGHSTCTDAASDSTSLLLSD